MLVWQFSNEESIGVTISSMFHSWFLLPIPLFLDHSMVRLGKGQAILGGYSNGVYQAKIYSMTCSNRNCIISLLNRELLIPNGNFVAIPIPDTISGCITGGKKHFQKKSIQSYIRFTLKYRLPVSNIDWGWFLPRLQQQSPLFFWWRGLLWTLCQ